MPDPSLSDRDLIALGYMAARLINCTPDAADRRRAARLQALGLCEPMTCHDGTPHPTWMQATDAGRRHAIRQTRRLVILFRVGVSRSGQRTPKPMSARRAERVAGRVEN